MTGGPDSLGMHKIWFLGTYLVYAAGDSKFPIWWFSVGKLFVAFLEKVGALSRGPSVPRYVWLQSGLQTRAELNLAFNPLTGHMPSWTKEDCSITSFLFSHPDVAPVRTYHKISPQTNLNRYPPINPELDLTESC